MRMSFVSLLMVRVRVGVRVRVTVRVRVRVKVGLGLGLGPVHFALQVFSNLEICYLLICFT
jgi:hypothetical protein